MSNKTLVVFFSASNVTKRVAEALAGLENADIYEIQPVERYSSADLDWTNSKSRSTIEMQDKKSRPEISGELPDLKNYDKIFIGFPIWWYTAPRIINTFLENSEISGKTFIPFATSGGTSIDKSVNDLKNSYPSANWKNGKLIKGRITSSDLKGWAE